MNWIPLISAAVIGTAGTAEIKRHSELSKSFGSKEYKIKKRTLSICSGGHQIYGELLLPDQIQGKIPTVICSHGFGSSYRACENAVGSRLAASGIAVCCFDFYGGNTHSKSGGKMTEMSVFSECADLDSVIDAVKKLPETDPDRLFLLGMSQGGFVSAVTASDHANEICGMVLWYPALCIADDAKKRHPTAEEIPETYRIMGRKVGRIYSEGLYGFDVFEKIKNYSGPVLLIHGDEDQIVDISYSKRAAEIYPNAELTILPGQKHGFFGNGKAAAGKKSYDFINAVSTDTYPVR